MSWDPTSKWRPVTLRSNRESNPLINIGLVSLPPQRWYKVQIKVIYFTIKLVMAKTFFTNPVGNSD